MAFASWCTTHTIAQASTLVLKIYICVNPKGTSEGRLRQQMSIGLGADSIAKAQAHAKAEIDKIVTEL